MSLSRFFRDHSVVIITVFASEKQLLLLAQDAIAHLVYRIAIRNKAVVMRNHNSREYFKVNSQM